MRIDIILPTLNRSDILDQVLARYVKLQAPHDGWRVILVNNGSTDETSRVAHKYSNKVPIEYVREDRRGKTMAVNTALDRTTADLVVFTDDDILPEPDWLTLYERAAENNPSYSVFAGPITLKWPYTAPAWATSNDIIEGECFACTNPKFTTGPHEHGIGGGNFGVRLDVIRQGFRFDPYMGPNGGSFPQGNESEFFHRLLRAGNRAWWIQEAAVQHIVRPEQLTQHYMWNRAARAGRGQFRIGVDHHGFPPYLFGFPRYVIKKLFKQSASVALKLSRNEIQHFENRWFLMYFWGALQEGWRMRREFNAAHGSGITAAAGEVQSWQAVRN